MEHQEALESITRKCLAFEEELGNGSQHISPTLVKSWQNIAGALYKRHMHTQSLHIHIPSLHCLYVHAAQQKQISRETQAVLKSQLMTMEVSSKEQ